MLFWNSWSFQFQSRWQGVRRVLPIATPATQTVVYISTICQLPANWSWHQQCWFFVFGSGLGCLLCAFVCFVCLVFLHGDSSMDYVDPFQSRLYHIVIMTNVATVLIQWICTMQLYFRLANWPAATLPCFLFLLGLFVCGFVFCCLAANWTVLVLCQFGGRQKALDRKSVTWRPPSLCVEGQVGCDCSGFSPPKTRQQRHAKFCQQRKQRTNTKRGWSHAKKAYTRIRLPPRR